MAVDLSIVIPTRNELHGIVGVLRGIDAVAEANELGIEVIVADDGSTDGTVAAARGVGHSGFLAIRVIERKPPYGFGDSIRDGISAAAGDAICIMMGDGSDDPVYLPGMLGRLGEGFDVVIGSRFLPQSKLVGYPTPKYYANRLFNSVARLFFMTRVNDLSNAFKLGKASVFKGMRLESMGFEISSEISLKALRSGCRVCQVPVSWREREAGTAKFKVSRVFLAYFSCLVNNFLGLVGDRLGARLRKTGKPASLA